MNKEKNRSRRAKSHNENSFWTSFSKIHWEKKPLLIKNFKNSILEINQLEIFQMLVAFANRCRKLKAADGFKLYIKGEMLHPAEVLQFLPELSDRDLIGYNKRMETYFSDYCLVCDELLQTSQNNWALLHQFTHDLFSQVGFPNRFVEMGLYLGNYRKTPFGVHVDGCGVFSFPVIGKKTFRLWTEDFGRKNKALDRALNYNRFKKDSITMKAERGDMTYWPSSAWHIAESDGSFNATWSLGVWVDKPHFESVEQALKPLLKAKHGAAGEQVTVKDFAFLKTGEVASMPKDFLNSIQAVKALTENELRDALMKDWLRLMSMQGFKNSFVLKFPKLTFRSKVQLPEAQVILWTQLKSKRKTYYAFQGVAAESQNSVHLKRLINDLNLGLSCRLSDYLMGSMKNDDLKLIQTLTCSK